MEFITPLPKTKQGNNAFQVVVDCISKLIRIIPTPSNVTTIQTAEIYCKHKNTHHGLSQVIISDRDKVFISNFWKEIFRFIGTKVRTSTAYYPQKNGQPDVMNRKIEELIRGYVNLKQSNLDEHLIEFEVTYNTSRNSTKNFTPFFLTYGYHSRVLPLDTLI